MAKRIAVLGLAVAAALALLLVTLKPGDTVANRDAVAIDPIDQNGAPLLAPPPTRNARSPLHDTGAIRASGRTERGHWLEFSADNTKPIKGGLLRVVRPVTMVHTDQAIEVRADRGTITDKNWVADPDGYPRFGRLEGNVVITITTATRAEDDDQPPEPSDRMQIRLEDAEFDYDLFEVSSDKSVRMTGPGYDLSGRGLTLTYNELRNRIEKLTLQSIDYIELQSARLVRPNESNNPPATSSGTGKAAPDTDGGKSTTTEPTQYYQARLEHEVVVESGDLDLTLDKLDIYFDFTGTASDDAPAPDKRSATAGSSGKPPTNHENEDKSPPSGDEAVRDSIRIRCSGPLTLNPADDPPAELSGPGDILVAMSGRPVHARSKEAETILAQRLSYQRSTELIRLFGSAAYPLMLESPGLGDLHAADSAWLELDPLGARLWGSGKLRTRGDASELLPEDVTVEWIDAMELTFFPGRNEAPLAEQLKFLRTMRNAAFLGGAKLQHARFDLKADRIGIGMKETDAGRPDPESLRAEGRVEANIFDEGATRPLFLRTDDLTLETKKDEHGKVYPARVLAVGTVHAVTTDIKIDAGILDVSLAQSAPDDTDDSDEQPTQHIRPTRMVAEHNVHVEFTTDGDIYLAYADKLVADMTTRQIELFGSETEPARIETKNGQTQIAGGHIIVDEVESSIQVIGPGTWSYRLARRGDKQDDEPGLMMVTWRGKMTYDHARAKVFFVDDVLSQARQGLESGRLTAPGDLMLFLTKSTSTVDNTNPATLAQGHTVKKLIATKREDKNVEFQATRRLKDDGKSVATRLTISGPEMRFVDTVLDGKPVEHIRFIGTGHLVYEDYRPKEEGASPSTPEAKVKFSGRGVTTFTWRGARSELRLDAVANQMRIYENIWMTHVAPQHLDEKQPPVDLECDRFVAAITDLEGGGGLDVWVSGAAPTPDIVDIIADKGVVVMQGDLGFRSGTLHYLGKEKSEFVTITPPRGGVTLVTTKDETIRQADPIRWNVKSGEWYLGRPGIIRKQLNK